MTGHPLDSPKTQQYFPRFKRVLPDGSTEYCYGFPFRFWCGFLVLAARPPEAWFGVQSDTEFLARWNPSNHEARKLLQRLEWRVECARHRAEKSRPEEEDG